MNSDPLLQRMKILIVDDEPANVALLQEGSERPVVAGEIAERADLLAPCPPAGSQQDGVAGADLDARLLLPGLDVLAVDVSGGLEIRHTLQAGDVQQDAARDNPILEGGDAQLRAASFFRDDVVEREAVIELPVVRHVTQRVEMRERRAVEADFLLLDGDSCPADDAHAVIERIRGVNRLLHQRIVRQRHGFARLRQRQRLLAPGRRRAKPCRCRTIR